MSHTDARYRFEEISPTAAEYVTLRLPPRTLKPGELESSGQRIISQNGKKTKTIDFFSIFVLTNNFFSTVLLLFT